jgi:hypothetical protein
VLGRLAPPSSRPALILLLLLAAFHADTRREIPAWGGLLQVYGAFFLPVIFALLFFLNLQVWARYRINYRFIFVSRPFRPSGPECSAADAKFRASQELDIRTVMDYRECVPSHLPQTNQELC